MIEAAFPLAKAGDAHDQEYGVEYRGEREGAAEIKRDVDEVRGDPEEPVFEALSAEEILGGEAEDGRERVPEGSGAVHNDEKRAQRPGAKRDGEQKDCPLEAGGSGDAEVRAVLAPVKPVEPAV